MTAYRLFLYFIILIFFGNCSKEESTQPDPSLDCSDFTETYSNGIEPLIKNNCALGNCHDGSNQRVDLSDYQAVFAASGMVRSQVNSKNMPPNGRNMSDQDRNRISCWISNGLPE